jgi:hypothetical protein
MIPTIENFIKLNKKRGTDSLFSDGFPGAGKSNFINTVGVKLGANGECLIMRGSAACEWRHFFNYPKSIKKITVLVPKGYLQHLYFMKYPEDLAEQIIEVDYETLDATDYINPGEVLVIYDECFTDEEKCWLIVDQLFKLMFRYRKREELYQVPVVYLEHEAGILFPMTPTASNKKILSMNHWKAVNKMVKIFVHFRKYFIRCLFLAQLQGEFTNLIRDKCFWKVLKQGKPKESYPASVKMKQKFERIDEYIIMIGEALYKTNQPIELINETKEDWMIIPDPDHMINYVCLEERNLEKQKEKKLERNGKNSKAKYRDKAIAYDYNYHDKTKNELAEHYNLSERHIDRILTKVDS